MDLFVCRELAEAGVGIAEHLDAAVVAEGVHVVDKVTVQDGAHLCRVLEEVWHVKYSVLRDKVHDVRGHACADVDGAADDGFSKLRRVAQLATGIDIYGDLSAGFLVDKLRELVDHHVVDGGIGNGHGCGPVVFFRDVRRIQGFDIRTIVFRAAGGSDSQAAAGRGRSVARCYGRQEHGNGWHVGDQQQGGEESRKERHTGLRKLQHRDLGHAGGDEEIDAHGWCNHADCQVAGHDDAEVDGVHPEGNSDRDHNWRQDHDVRDVIDDHAADQHDEVHDQQDDDLVIGDSQDRCTDRLWEAQHRQAFGEGGRCRDDEEDVDIGLGSFHKDAGKIRDLHTLIDEQADEETVKDADDGGFSRTADAGVDGAEDDDGSH